MVFFLIADLYKVEGIINTIYALQVELQAYKYNNFNRLMHFICNLYLDSAVLNELSYK